MTSIEEGSARRVWGPRMFTAMSATLARLSRSASPPVYDLQRARSGEIMSSKTSQEGPAIPEQMPASRRTIQVQFSRTTSSELDGRTVEGSEAWDDVAVSSDTSPASLPPPSHLATPAAAYTAYTRPRRTSLMDIAPISKKGALSASTPSRTMPISCRNIEEGRSHPSSMLLAFESVEDWGLCTPYDDTPPQQTATILRIGSAPESAPYGAGFSKFAHL